MRRSRAAALSVGALLGLAFAAALARVIPTTPPRSVTFGCTHYPIVQAMFVCRGKVFVLLRGRLEYAGEARDLAPMPEPPQSTRQS